MIGFVQNIQCTIFCKSVKQDCLENYAYYGKSYTVTLAPVESVTSTLPRLREAFFYLRSYSAEIGASRSSRQTVIAAALIPASHSALLKVSW